MKTAMNEQGIEYLTEPLTPQEQVDVLANGKGPGSIVVPVPADTVPDSDGFYDTVNALVVGGGGPLLQMDSYERVGWLDKDTVLYGLNCFLTEEQIRDSYGEHEFAEEPRG